MQSFEFTYNGLTFNTIASIRSGAYIAVQRVDGFSSPDMRHNQSIIQGNHGWVDSLSYLDGRLITLEGVVHADTESARYTLEASMTRALMAPDIPRPDNDGYHQLIFAKTGETSKFVNAKIHALPKFTKELSARGTSSFIVQFRCQDPRIYSVSQNQQHMEKSLLVGGLPSPLPMTLPGGGYTNQKILTNNGHWAAPMTYRIENTGESNIINPKLWNITYDQYQEFAMTLEPDEYIDVDTLAGTAVDQDGNDVLVNETSDSSWLYVHPGSNLYRLTCSSGEPEADIYWRHTFISAPR